MFHMYLGEAWGLAQVSRGGCSLQNPGGGGFARRGGGMEGTSTVSGRGLGRTVSPDQVCRCGRSQASFLKVSGPERPAAEKS